jgi:hypothetical protein
MADNFLVAGFREVERKFSRFSLRQKMGQQSTQRTVALAALGQRAWEERVDLSAFAELRDRLTALDTRAGEISQTAGKLESGKSALEQERRSALDAFAARRREVEDKKKPVDAALRAGRARRTECEQVIAQAEARLAKIPGELAALEKEPAGQERRSSLASEQKDLEAKLAPARVELPGLSAEESRLAGESQQYTGQIAAIDAEQKAALARIDAELSRVQSELRGASQQASATEKDRGETFGSLGLGLYDSGTSVPALAECVARVAAIDQTRAETESAFKSSLTLTGSLAPGTMVKFWGVVVGAPLLLLVLGLGANRYFNPGVSPQVAEEQAAAEQAAAMQHAVNVDPEDAKLHVVQRFALLGEGDDKTVRESALAILKADIETMGASGQAAYLPILTKVLSSPHAELRLAAADSIGMIGPTAAETPELTRLLNDPVPGVAAAARRALAERPPPR